MINIANTASGTLVVSAATTIPANASRVGGFIQNLSVNKLYVKFGTGAATSSFSCVLVGGTAEDDGYGGSQPLDGYNGLISFAGTSPRCNVVEFIR